MRAAVVIVVVLAAVLALPGCKGRPPATTTATLPPTLESRRERLLDFVTRLDEAEVELEPGGLAPKLVGDHTLDADDDRLEATVSLGTRLRFRDVPIHDGATLRFAVGPCKPASEEAETPSAHALCLLAFERGDGSLVPLAEFEVEVAGGRVEGEVDLSSFRGERGTLLVRSHGGDPKRRVAWSRLELASEGRPETPADRTITLETVAGDLAALASADAGSSGLVPLTVPGAFEVRTHLPEGARLSFFLETTRADGKDTMDGGRNVEVRVLVDGTPLSERLVPRYRPHPQSFRSYEDIDLEPFAGREVDLRIEVHPRVRRARGVNAQLGLPRILTRRTVPRASSRSSPTPDVFLIVVDTLRADGVGCHGSRRPTTPNLDEFARAGLVYERAYSQSAWTLPSTASLLGGRHPDEHGVKTFRAVWLADDEETIAERLAERGYSCGAFVANSLVSRDSNFDQGFETFLDLNWANARKVVAQSLAWLDEHEEDRVFGYLHFVDPHAPYEPPLTDSAAIEGFELDGNPFANLSCDELFRRFSDPEALSSITPRDIEHATERARALYDAEIRYFDRWFGEFIAALRARGRLENSVILVTADHGEEFYEHGGFFHAHQLYEELVRVPFVLRAPGLTPGRVANPIDGLQVKPLLLDLAGAGVAADPDELARAHFPEAIHLTTELGRDPVLSGVNDGTQGEQDGSVEDVRRDAALNARWKLIETPRLARAELFDLAADPGESEDACAREPRMLGIMQRLLELWRESHPRGALPWSPVSPDLQEHLRAMGYVK